MPRPKVQRPLCKLPGCQQTTASAKSAYCSPYHSSLAKQGQRRDRASVADGVRTRAQRQGQHATHNPLIAPPLTPPAFSRLAS